MKASHSLSYQQRWCNFSIWTTLQSSKFCQLWSFDFMLCHVKKVSETRFFCLENLVFFFFLKMYVKITQLRTKVLICPNWNSIFKIWDTLFELKQVETQCSKSYFKIILVWTSEGNFDSVIKTVPKNNIFFKKIF